MTSSLATWLLLAVAASPVDQILETTWREKGVEPASVCTDEEFLRRIMLDLVGRTKSARFRLIPIGRARLTSC